MENDHANADPQATKQTAKWALVGVLAIAAIFGAWLILAPTDRSVDSARKPVEAPKENTGSNRPNLGSTQGVPTPPTIQAPSTDQQTVPQGSGGAGSDSTRSSGGPESSTQSR